MNSLQKETLAQFPNYNITQINGVFDAAYSQMKHKIVVLDDDPTGSQTVHGVPVYTRWDRESIREAFAAPGRLFYILTNSRAFSETETRRVHTEIGENLAAVSLPFLLISRGDSTLRGHYPLETETLRQTLERQGARYDGEILCPFFAEGGRYTIDNIHYVAYGDALVPAGETEYAGDKTFGYQSSDLPSWIAEKYGDRHKPSVTCISLAQLRGLDYTGIERALDEVSGFGKVVVNAVSYEDLLVFCTAFVRVLAKGRRFLVRSAASFVKVIGAISHHPLLSGAQLRDPCDSNGGLVIVGSHVNKTTAQLEALRGYDGAEFVEINQHLVVDSTAFEAEMVRAAALTDRLIASGKTAVVHTRRERFDVGGGPEEELRCATMISDKLTGIPARIAARPSFIIAKGGITSSDVATKGLGIRRAEVMGQLLPGIPVWKTGEESLFPGLPYVIFPGNVGEDNALRQAVEELSAYT